MRTSSNHLCSTTANITEVPGWRASPISAKRSSGMPASIYFAVIPPTAAPAAPPMTAPMGPAIRPIPPGQLAVRRGARVRATDGPVGRIDEFLVDTEKCHITHLVLREGNLLGKKSITIPVSEIDHIEEKVVHLKIDKKAVRMMPTIKVKRLW